MTLRIDQLPPMVSALLTNEIAAIEAGTTGKLTLQQVSTLITAAIVGSAPATLDTLGEIADALNDDANAVDTLTALIATKLAVAGGTMTGDIDMGGNKLAKVGQINAGPVGGFKNWIINGDFTVNQRSGTKTPGVGVYGYDRWKGHANGLEQVIEALPAGDYTLTFGGGGTGSVDGLTPVSSPAVFTVAVAGDISVVVPSTATRVSLVRGDVRDEDDPYEERPIHIEEMLCFRYYLKDVEVFASGEGSTTGQTNRCPICFAFPVPMRTTPTTTYVTVSNTNVGANPTAGVDNTNRFGAALGPQTNSGGGLNSWLGQLTFDAEF